MKAGTEAGKQGAGSHGIGVHAVKRFEADTLTEEIVDFLPVQGKMMDEGRVGDKGILPIY